MKNKLLSLYARMRKKFPDWLNAQNIVFVSVITAFFIIVLWSEPLSHLLKDPEPIAGGVSPTATTLFGTPTPLPEEWLRSAEQTNGIVLGAIIIILAIVAGTAAILVRDRD